MVLRSVTNEKNLEKCFICQTVTKISFSKCGEVGFRALIHTETERESLNDVKSADKIERIL